MAKSPNADDAAARRLVRSIVRRNWPALGGAGVSTILLTLADLAQPWPLAFVIDSVLTGRSVPFELSSEDVRTLALIAAAVVGIALVTAVATYTGELWLKRAGERITHELRIEMYTHLQRLSLAFHDRRQKGDLVARLTEDANEVGKFFSDTIGTIAQAILMLVGMAIVSLLIDPLLGLAMLAVSPVLLLVSAHYRREVKYAARSQRKNEGEIASLAAESLSAMRVVKAFGGEAYERGRVVERSEERRRHGITAAVLEARFSGAVDVLGAAAIAIVLVLGVLRVAAGAISVGDLVVIAQYARRMYRPLSDLAKQSTKAARAMARAERVAEVLAADEVLDERPGAYDGGRARGEIALEDVSFGYDPGRPVLEDLSLHIEAGSRVAVVGPSGAGKSTVGALIARFYDPGSGRVLIDGRDARDCSLPWLRTQVGLLLQDTVLFTGTVADNIAYGSGASREEIIRAARAADADDFISGLPQGYDDELGPQGIGLSGGQRQRIGIARVLLRNPPILLLDEPTTGLDAASETQVMDGLTALMRDRTTVLITHSMALARSADVALVVDDGRIVQHGAPADLLRAAGPFRRLAAEQGLVRRPRRAAAPPADEAVPALRALLDGDHMAPVLRRSLGRDANLDEVTVQSVRYRPGAHASVLYEATIDGVGHEVVARAGRPDALAARAADPDEIAIARAVNGRSPAATPLTWDARAAALIQWLPLDLDLPLLCAAPDEVAQRLRGLGIVVGADGLERLSYVPGRRVTLRAGGHVVRGYAREDDFRRALAGDRLAASVHMPSLRTRMRRKLSGRAPAPVLDGPAASFAGAIPGLLATVHAAGDGVDAPTGAYEAGVLLRHLRRLPGDGLERATPEDTLHGTLRSADVLRHVAPAAYSQVNTLAERLADTLPDAGAPVIAHGKFRLGGLTRAEGRLVAADLAHLRIADPAVDVASYAADIAARDGLDAGLEAAGALLDGLGERPAALRWHVACMLLRRAERPFRALEEDWPVRVEEIVAAGHAALDR